MENFETRCLTLLQTTWKQCIGRLEKDPIVEYIFESIIDELNTNGLPSNSDATIERFEDVIHNSQKVRISNLLHQTLHFSFQVDIEDCHAFCTRLFHHLEAEFVEEDVEDEDCLEPGQCEMCERYIPLTRHHLIPRTLHNRLKKKGYNREVLDRTISICRCCHNAVHHFYSNKELAFDFNTLDKLMEVSIFNKHPFHLVCVNQSDVILKHASWASKQPVRTKRK